MSAMGASRSATGRRRKGATAPEEPPTGPAPRKRRTRTPSVGLGPTLFQNGTPEPTERPAESQPAVRPRSTGPHPKNPLNELSASEWIPETVSVWTQRGLGAGHRDAQIERQHPAPFSFTDVARLVRFFTKRDGVVLDPFAGVGSTLKACALESRCGIGIDLNQKYVGLTHERLRVEVPESNPYRAKQTILEGDARSVLGTLPADSVDFVVTSPPYWNILHKEDHKAEQERKSQKLDTRYGDDSRDLGNIPDYTQFLAALTEILSACSRVLKRKRYMAVIVSDFRDKSAYVMFHADLARSLSERGFGLRGLKILYQRHKRVFPYGYPYAYVPNIHHQYILILQNTR